MCSQVAKVSKLKDTLYSRVELNGLVVFSRLVRSIALANFFKALFMAKSSHCNAELSCSTAFPTGYASRRSSSSKSLEQLFRVDLVLLFSNVSEQHIILVTFFSPSLWRRGLDFVLCYAIK